MNEENHMVMPFADDDLREDDYEIDEDTQFEEQRQAEIDDEHAKRVTDGLVKALPDIMMFRDQA